MPVATCATCGFTVTVEKEGEIPRFWGRVDGKTYCNAHHHVAEIRAEARLKGN